jgi:hypothetical protein
MYTEICTIFGILCFVKSQESADIIYTMVEHRNHVNAYFSADFELVWLDMTNVSCWFLLEKSERAVLHVRIGFADTF